jgi:hypothetical protein
MGRERPELRMGADAEFRNSPGCCTQEDDSTTQNRFCWAWLVGAVLLILWLLGFGLNVAGSLTNNLLVLAIVILLIDLVRGHATA